MPCDLQLHCQVIFPLSPPLLNISSSTAILQNKVSVFAGGVGGWGIGSVTTDDFLYDFSFLR